MIKDKSRIQSCVDHINTAVDVDPWAKELVVEMGKEVLKYAKDINVPINDTISRQAAIDALNKMKIYRPLDSDRYVISDCLNKIVNLPSAQPEPCGDVVSRNAIVQKLNEMDRYVSTELRLCDTDKKFPQNEVFIVDDVYEEIVEQLPSAQPERYTKEELRVFQHGISLSLLSKRSAQHWQYDEDTATEIKFLERLYEKVGADMRGEQDG